MAAISPSEYDSTLMDLHAIEREMSQRLLESRLKSDQDWKDSLQADQSKRKKLLETCAQLQDQVYKEELAQFQQELSVLQSQQEARFTRDLDILQRRIEGWVSQWLEMILTTSEEESE